MATRISLLLVAALVVSACAKTDFSERKDGILVGKYSTRVDYITELDLEGSPRESADCVREKLLQNIARGNRALHTATPVVEDGEDRISVVGETAYSHPYAVILTDNGTGTHAAVYGAAHFLNMRQTAETVTGIVRSCGLA